MICLFDGTSEPARLCVRLVLCCAAQKLKMLINQKYRINMVLDNLPVTAQDLLDKVGSRTQQQQPICMRHTHSSSSSCSCGAAAYQHAAAAAAGLEAQL
jgi:hypothetical protein